MEEQNNAIALKSGTYIGNNGEQRYRIDSILGSGGFGITYKAVDTIKNTVCAVKEYVPVGLCIRTDNGMLVSVSEENSKYYEHGRERFIEEAGEIMELSDVANVVRVYDCFGCNGTAYFVMDYLDGCDVRTLMHRLPEKKFQLDLALNILSIVGAALETIHTTKKVLHRDISPDNIFYCNDGSIYLIDFGSAKHICKQENQNFSVVLKPGFAPIEQYSSRVAQGTYTDVYALAGTFYYMITGKTIPPATERINGKDYVKAYMINKEVPQKISDAIDAALDLNYKMRTQTVRMFMEALFQDNKVGFEDKENELVPEPVMVTTKKLAGEDSVNNKTKSDTKRKRAFVELANSEFSGKRWYLPPNEELVVGRSSKDCNIVVPPYEAVSKQHCHIMFDRKKECFFVMDISSYGTTTEQIMCPKNQWIPLEEQHLIILAAVCCLKIGVEYE